MFKRLRLDHSIMRERLPVGLIAVIGQQGAGKTSCGVAWMCNDFKYHGLERYNECKAYTEELNRNGYHLHLPKNKCIYYSPDIEVLSFKPYVETWKCDPSIFELPNLKRLEENLDIQYFPRGSVIHLPEFDNMINCRDWHSMSPYLIALAKYARHWDLTIIIDFQSWYQLDIAWRRLMMYTCFMLEKWKKDNWLRRLFKIKQKLCWKYLLVNNQLNTFCTDINSTMVDKKVIKEISKNVSVLKKNVFKGDIDKRYKGTTAEAYFLRGIKDYKYIPHKKYPKTPEEMEEYCRTHPLIKAETKKSS